MQKKSAKSDRQSELNEMKSITCLGGSYLMEKGLLSRCGELVFMKLKPQKLLIVSDSNVFPLYGPGLLKSFQNYNVQAEYMVFPAGEDAKSFDNLQKILVKLSEENFSRSDLLIALGGGVIGDLGGFAASVFKRGMKLMQIPTSLLAMVDSSVGGKTAVNLGSVKNQVGSFYQPQLILADTDCLSTLPEREYRCGCGEIIKYSVLFDEGFFDLILAQDIKEQYEDVIEKCVRYKSLTVMKDERDAGCRQLLNLGHSFGHAVEALSSYEIAHGEAVAIGMFMVMKAAAAKGLCDSSQLLKLREILDKYNLPSECGFPPEKIMELLLKDKKFTDGKLNLIVPEKIGKCSIMALSPEEISSWLSLI